MSLKALIVILFIVWWATGCTVTIVQPPALVIQPQTANTTHASSQRCNELAVLPAPVGYPKPPVVPESQPAALADALALYALQLKRAQRQHLEAVDAAFKQYVKECGVK